MQGNHVNWIQKVFNFTPSDKEIAIGVFINIHVAEGSRKISKKRFRNKI